MLHELAHIYHHDHILGLLQRIIKALYWWNPLVYNLCNSLSVAREEISDNHAICGMGSAVSYASLLVRDMRVKIGKRAMSLILLTAVLLCAVVAICSQVAVFGVGQAPSSGQKTNEPRTAPMSGKSISGELIIVDGPTILSNRLVHEVVPIYPGLCIKERVTGRVELEVTVNEEGLVSDVRVAKGHPLFNEAASTAVKQWKFHPSIVAGSKTASGGPVPPPPRPAPGTTIRGVPFRITIVIDFRLDRDDSPKCVISASGHNLL